MYGQWLNSIELIILIFKEKWGSGCEDTTIIPPYCITWLDGGVISRQKFLDKIDMENILDPQNNLNKLITMIVTTQNSKRYFSSEQYGQI